MTATKVLYVRVHPLVHAAVRRRAEEAGLTMARTIEMMLRSVLNVPDPATERLRALTDELARHKAT